MAKTIKKPAKKQNSGKRGGKTRTSWKPGQSGNPAGRPALGESYKEIFAAAGNLTIKELRERYPTYNRFENVADDVKLKELVSLSVLVTLACEPSPGMLATLLDRTDGPLEHTLNINKLKDDELASAIQPILDRLGIRLIAPVQSGLEGGDAIGFAEDNLDAASSADATTG